MIDSCEVLEDKDGVVTRQVKFKKGAGPVDEAREVVRSFWPSWVCFAVFTSAFSLFLWCFGYVFGRFTADEVLHRSTLSRLMARTSAISFPMARLAGSMT